MEKVPYIKAQFSGDWRENTDDRIVVMDSPVDFSGDIVLKYFEMIYSGSRSQSNLQFSKENVVEILRLSDYLNDEMTKNEAIQFIRFSLDKVLVEEIFCSLLSVDIKKQLIPSIRR